MKTKTLVMAAVVTFGQLNLPFAKNQAVTPSHRNVSNEDAPPTQIDLAKGYADKVLAMTNPMLMSTAADEGPDYVDFVEKVSELKEASAKLSPQEDYQARESLNTEYDKKQKDILDQITEIENKLASESTDSQIALRNSIHLLMSRLALGTATIAGFSATTALLFGLASDSTITKEVHFIYGGLITFNRKIINEQTKLNRAILSGNNWNIVVARRNIEIFSKRLSEFEKMKAGSDIKRFDATVAAKRATLQALKWTSIFTISSGLLTYAANYVAADTSYKQISEAEKTKLYSELNALRIQLGAMKEQFELSLIKN